MRVVFFGVLAMAGALWGGTVHAETLYHVGERSGTIWGCGFEPAKTGELTTRCWVIEGANVEINDSTAKVDCTAKTVTSPDSDKFEAGKHVGDIWGVSLAQREQMALFLAVCHKRPLAYLQSKSAASPWDKEFLGSWLRLKEGSNKVPRNCSTKNEDDVQTISRKKINDLHMGCDVKEWTLVGAGLEVVATCYSEGEKGTGKSKFVRRGDILFEETVGVEGGSVSAFRQCGRK